jgi:predicted transcriptional regulator
MSEPDDQAKSYDDWFRRQVLIGLESANAGKLIPAEDVEAEFAARRAETRRKRSVRGQSPIHS